MQLMFKPYRWKKCLIAAAYLVVSGHYALVFGASKDVQDSILRVAEAAPFNPLQQQQFVYRHIRMTHNSDAKIERIGLPISMPGAGASQLQMPIRVAMADASQSAIRTLSVDTPEPILDKRSDIEVKTAEVKSPFGGAQTVYYKTRVKPINASIAAKTPAQSAVSNPHPSIKNSTYELAMDSLPSDWTNKPPVVVKADESAFKATQLLRQLKKGIQSNDAYHLALNEATMSSSKVNENGVESLQLSPGESLVRPQPRNAMNKVPQKKSEDNIIDRLEFNQANLLDVSRALADISGLNFVATEEAAKKSVTVFLQKISVKHALDAITKNSGLWYRQDKDSGTFRIMTTEEYQRDLVVYREDITRVFTLLHPNPVNVATAIRDLYGTRVIMTYGANYDDFSNGQFNTGGRTAGQTTGQTGLGTTNGNGNNLGAGTGMGAGQAGLRTTVTTGNTQTNQALGMTGQIGGNTQNSGSGTLANGAITERLTADQIIKLENQIDERGNLISSDAARGISRAQQPIYVTVSRQQNILIVRTSDSAAVREIENLVKALDKPTPQVLLEMRILEVDVGDTYTQLFSFGKLSSNGKESFTARQDADLAGTGKFVYTFVDNLIGLRLELLEKDNKVKTVSSPVLLASNNRSSRLFIGEERLLVRGATLTDPVLGVNGQVVTPGRISYNTEIRNVGNTLNITPKINADGTVTLGVFQDTSTVDAGAIPFPPLIANNGQVFNFSVDSVLTSNIEGVVVAKDGLTVAIGGLIRTSTSKMENKIPVLGDLPVVGGLFKDKQEVNSRKELVLLITPHIITTPVETDDVSRDAVEPLTNLEW